MHHVYDSIATVCCVLSRRSRDGGNTFVAPPFNLYDHATQKAPSWSRLQQRTCASSSPADRELALKESVSITHHGRETLVVLSAEEFKRLKALDTRQAFYAWEIPEDLANALETAEPPSVHGPVQPRVGSAMGGGVPLPDPEPGFVIRYAYLWKSEEI